MLFGAIAILICVVFATAAWTAVNNPAFASILNNTPPPAAEVHWAQVEISKPLAAAFDISAFANPETAVTATPSPVDEPTALPTDVPTDEPAVASSDSESAATPVPPDPELASSDPEAVIVEPAETPAQLSMEIVPSTPTSVYVAPVPNAAAPKPSVASSGDTRWIDVDLTHQSVYAYEGDTIVNSFIVSTGTWATPTVTGQYKVYVKYRSAKMSGPGYYLPNVPYIMYFYGSYGLHGTYWHNNFGTPMSHGCVNLRTEDAEWLFNWASVGTVVNVHY